MGENGNPGISSTEAMLLAANMQHIQKEQERQGRTLESISQSLQLLARVEQSQIHINERLKEGSQKITDHEQRIAHIENKLPGLVEVRAWVIGGILAGLAMIATVTFKTLFPH